MKKRWISYAVAACLTLSVVIGVIEYRKYQAIYHSHLSELIEKSEIQLQVSERVFASFELQLKSTIQLLGRSRSLFDYVSSPNEIDRRQVQEVWRSVTSYEDVFRKIRYVDKSGHELIKVETIEPFNASVVNNNLTDVSDQSYFKYARSLELGKTGTLNIELERSASTDRLIEPYRAVQYTIVPYEIMGKRQGYIIIDLDFWLSDALRFLGDSSESSPMIVTAGGDYVEHPDDTKRFGFQLPSRKQFNLSLTDPELWKLMQANDSGSFRDKDDVFVFKKLTMEKVGTNYVLIKISQQQLDEQLVDNYNSVVQQAVLMIIMLIAVVVPSSYLFVTINQRRLDGKLALAALNGMSAVLICDSKYLMLKVNKEFENITGYTEKQIRYGNVRKLLSDRRDSTHWFNVWESVAKERFWEGELKIRGRGGIELTTITRMQAVSDSNGQVENYIISIVDISARKELEEQLRYLSERDALTQLWNRRKFESELRNQTLLTERYPENHLGCLALVDIDHFKKINDEKGHDEGDVVIKKVATTLVNQTRRTDFVSRIGGEEFAILMPHTDLENAVDVLERVRLAVSDDPGLDVTISIGLTDLSSDGTHSYKCADIALYESKSLGRNRTSLCHSTNDFA